MLNTYRTMTDAAGKFAAAGAVAHERLMGFNSSLKAAQEYERNSHDDRMKYLASLVEQTNELLAIIEGKDSDSPSPEAPELPEETMKEAAE